MPGSLRSTSHTYSWNQDENAECILKTCWSEIISLLPTTVISEIRRIKKYCGRLCSRLVSEYFPCILPFNPHDGMLIIPV